MLLLKKNIYTSNISTLVLLHSSILPIEPADDIGDERIPVVGTDEDSFKLSAGKTSERRRSLWLFTPSRVSSENVCLLWCETEYEYFCLRSCVSMVYKFKGPSPAYPGRKGSRKTQKIRTPIVIFIEILLFKPDTLGGGLKVLNFAGRTLWPLKKSLWKMRNPYANIQVICSFNKCVANLHPELGGNVRRRSFRHGFSRVQHRATNCWCVRPWTLDGWLKLRYERWYRAFTTLLARRGL